MLSLQPALFNIHRNLAGRDSIIDVWEKEDSK